MYSCQDASGATIDAANVLPPGARLTKDWCLDASTPVNASAYHAALGVAVPPYSLARSWSRGWANFDNIGAAALTLFSISTTELWVDTMYATVDAAGVDLQPTLNARPAAAAFYVVFMVFGTFFILQLFVSVTLDKVGARQQWRLVPCARQLAGCRCDYCC